MEEGCDFNLCKLSGIIEGWRVFPPRWPGDLPSATASLIVREGKRNSVIYLRTTEGCMERLLEAQRSEEGGDGRVVVHGRLVEEKWGTKGSDEAGRRGRLVLHTGRVLTMQAFKASEEWEQCIADVETNRRLLGLPPADGFAVDSPEFELLNGLSSVPWERGETPPASGVQEAANAATK